MIMKIKSIKSSRKQLNWSSEQNPRSKCFYWKIREDEINAYSFPWKKLRGGTANEIQNTQKKTNRDKSRNP